MVSNELWIDSPTGVELGRGYDYVTGELRPSIGIAFIEAKESGQDKSFVIKEVSERYGLMEALDLSFEAQYKSLTIAVEGKAKFCRDVNINGSFESFVAHAKVLNRKFAATVAKNESEKIGNLFDQGKKSAEINKYLEIDSKCYAERFPLAYNGSEKSLINSLKSDEDRGIYLTNEALKTLNKDGGLEKFKKIYGDSFVAVIEEGAEIDVVMNFTVIDQEEKKNIAASMKGSYAGFEVGGSVETTMENYNKKSQLEIYYHQTGGNSDPMPMKINEFKEKIQSLPDIAEKGPKPYRVLIIRYDSLPNWPENVPIPSIEITPQKERVRRYFEYRSLFEDIQYILNNIKGFGLGRGVEIETLKKSKDDLMSGMRAILNELDNYKKTGKIAEEMPTEAQKPDYEFRVNMPLPVSSQEEFNKMSDDILKELILKMYVKKISEERYNRNGINDPGCLSEKQIDEYAGKIIISGYHPRYLTLVLDSHGAGNITNPIILDGKGELWKNGTILGKRDPPLEFNLDLKKLETQSLDGTFNLGFQTFCLGGGGHNIQVARRSNKTYLIPVSDHYLFGLLNSALLRLFIHSVSTDLQGNSFNFSAVFVERTPIRTIDSARPAEAACHDRIVSLVDQMLSLHKQLPEARTPHEQTSFQRQIEATDGQIDALVYQLYGLTEEEIKIVKGM